MRVGHYRVKAGRIIVGLAILLTAALLGLLIAAQPRLTIGVVVDKRYEAAWIGGNADVTTDAGHTTRVQVGQTYWPAQWWIRVLGTLPDGTQGAEWWSVGDGLYKLIQIGDAVERDERTGVIRLQEP